ncbi:phosphatidylinositol-3,5-bisphosphate 5-phosphatase [Malassezia yamatoensis]|uniref:Phosphatidylinositol-3,5-bisphosphate 5-phosphatase n=1 Tax=Malassezia yamatoensis TaxID=253288 RepID=A0AAJ6CHJ7_9BASI|nr:phosphatidylinositol-3,5-bisphosphate 5-phosphatase [Malassezia yamatoensis]
MSTREELRNEQDPRVLAAVSDVLVPTEVFAIDTDPPDSGFSRSSSLGGSTPHVEAPFTSALTDNLERLGEVKRFTLYETRTHFYFVAQNTNQSRFRILTIDRIPPILSNREDSNRDTVSEDVVASHKSENSTDSRSTDENTSSKHVADNVSQTSNNKNARSQSIERERAKASNEPANKEEDGPVQTPLKSTSGLPYLSTDDDEIPRLRETTEWKTYAPQIHDNANDASQSTLSTSTDTSERKVPSIAALGAPRTFKQTNNPNRLESDLRESEQTTSDETRTSKPHEDQAKQSMDEDAWKLRVTTDDVHYTKEQLTRFLNTIREESRSHGGLKEVGGFFGLVGFVRFTSTYHMVLVSRRSAVALIGGHYVYHCDETQILPVCHASYLSNVPGSTKARDQIEAQLLRTFRQVDLSKNFYFSYTYDITRTLQEIMTGPRHSSRLSSEHTWDLHEKWVWNYHLLLPAFDDCRHVDATPSSAKRRWVMPLVHGFVDQAKLLVLGRTIYITLIARRSRHFAGARFHKRGINSQGYVANDVETEQIVNEPITSPFYSPSALGSPFQHTPSPLFTSYVMLRGSIPVYWTQDNTNMSPRPPITISLADPYFLPAMRHFDNLFRSYGTPVIVVNLIKTKERQPRESKLLHAYSECVEYLNQFLPNGSDGQPDRRIRYIAWDMSRASKSRDQDVICILESMAENILDSTRFFHSGNGSKAYHQKPKRDPARWDGGCGEAKQHFDPTYAPLLLQQGVARMNCVDCLDRTNAAQFVLGKVALAHQLYALGLLQQPKLSFDSDAINMLTEMYHDLGDTIALQYGGSALAHTTDTYRKINHWTSHSRDMIEGLKRYYANSFADADKQASIDLFLGHDLDVDTPSVSTNHPLPAPALRGVNQYLTPGEDLEKKQAYILTYVNADRHFWTRYYRPGLFTDLQRHHAYKMTAVHQGPALLPDEAFPALNHASPTPDPLRNEYAAPPIMVEPSTAMQRIVSSSSRKSSSRQTNSSSRSKRLPSTLLGGVKRWMHPRQSSLPRNWSDNQYDTTERADQKPVRKQVPTTDTNLLEAAVAKSLSPTISKQEQREYAAYTTQFQQLQFQRMPRTIDLDMQIYDQCASFSETTMHTPLRPASVDPALSAYIQIPRNELGANSSKVPIPRTRMASAPVLPVNSHATPSQPVNMHDLNTLDPKARAYAAWLHITPVR